MTAHNLASDLVSSHVPTIAVDKRDLQNLHYSRQSPVVIIIALDFPTSER